MAVTPASAPMNPLDIASHGPVIPVIVIDRVEDALALLLPALAVGARRLHDIGRSGWWQLLSLTGIGTLVLIYWWVQPSGE